MTRVDVAVVGGGMAGLSAAYELHRRGVSFVLLEGSPRLGGMIRTESVGGFTIDAGPQVKAVCLPEAAPAVADRLRALPGVKRVVQVGLGPGACIEEQAR